MRVEVSIVREGKVIFFVYSCFFINLLYFQIYNVISIEIMLNYENILEENSDKFYIVLRIYFLFIYGFQKCY